MTRAPDLAAPRSTGDANQIYKPEDPVDRLGLIDPDFTPEGPATGISNRLLTYVWITGAQAGDPDARVAVVDAENPESPVLQQLVADMSGETQLYRPTGVFLPQGSSLQVRGLRPSPGGQIKIRLDVIVLDDPLSTASALEAICCAAGTGNFPDVEEDGVLAVPDAAFLDFEGDGVSVTPLPGPRARITIPGGLPPIQTADFDDDTTIDLLLGAQTDGYFAVEANISNDLGGSLSIRADVSVSSSGADASLLEINSDVAISTIIPSVVVAAGQVFLRLVGTGPGTATTVNYRLADAILRAFP